MPGARNRKDVHSFSNPEQIRVTHVDLDVETDFKKKVIRGTATLNVQRAASYREGPIVLDTRDLKIEKAEASSDGQRFTPSHFDLGTSDPILGTPLTIELPAKVVSIRMQYESSPNASGLQWLEPSQTAGKQHPYLYSQGQAIHTRSWIPLQDSPGVRVTYSALVHTPPELRAVMSADHDLQVKGPGLFKFAMRRTIPSYLIAIAVGDLEFVPTSRSTGIYGEPSIVKMAAHEFDNTSAMIVSAESLYGPYYWDRFDILVLPPSFPFGGMENPRLTFATPTIVAGDRSLVSVIIHELAHSWSGNLVTNATWSDFWLNEGFTVYLERRIQELLSGPDQATMEAVLERDELIREMKGLKPEDQILHIDLKGRDPDDGVTQVPYIKGMLFLRALEEAYGRQRFDAFLRTYFERFAFQSIVTEDFMDYLKENLINQNPDVPLKISLDEWIYKPGLPASMPQFESVLLTKVKEAAEGWSNGKLSLGAIASQDWSTQQWLQFLTAMPDKLGSAKMVQLDAAFHFTKSGNAEILDQWLLMAIKNSYEPAFPRMRQFLIEVGRRKYAKPLYEELAKTPAGKQRARTIFDQARPGYHPILVKTISDVLK